MVGGGGCGVCGSKGQGGEEIGIVVVSYAY